MAENAMIKNSYVRPSCEIQIMPGIDMLDGRLSYIRSSALLLFLLVTFIRNGNFVESPNVISIYRYQIVAALSENNPKRKTGSDRTVSYWINALAKNGVIKYRAERHNEPKAPAQIFLNPALCFVGSATEYRETCHKWEIFKSDIKPVKPEYVII